MKSGSSIIGTLYANELRMVLRDRRTIVTSIVLPLLVMPLMLFGSNWAQQKRQRTLEETTYSYAVTGSKASAARALIDATRARLSREAGTSGAGFRLTEVDAPDPAASLEKGDIAFYLEGIPGEDARREAEQKKAAAKDATMGEAAGRDPAEMDDTESARPGAPSIRIVFRADRDLSESGFRRMRDALRETRRVQRAELLTGHGILVSPSEVGAVVEHSVATEGQVAGLALGRLLTLMLLLFIMSGGAVVATDSLAGEKERGTLETLLTTAASRVDIIAAKLLVILTVALVITVIQAMNFLVYVGFKLIPVSAGFAAAVPPQVALLLFVLYLPVSALASSVLLLMSGYARTYKEAQLYFFPVFLLGMIPALAPFLPGLTLRSAIVIVPVANLSVAVKEVLVGNLDWPMMALAWLVTALAALWTSRQAVRALSVERLITASEGDRADLTGGPALFPRHVGRWFAVMWALLFVIALNMPPDTDIRVQVLINVIGLFFGATVLMIRHYRLDVREVLALRPVKPAVWFAVLVAAPAGLVATVGVFKLASLFVPVPPGLLESFGQQLLPAGIPLWQSVALLSLLPAVFEEVTFRGALLHGLRARLHPAALALVVGVVFGLFHIALFRIAPTAFLGIMLAAVTLLTGSIFPAMLWHGLNNGMALLLGQVDIPLDQAEWRVHLAGAAILAAAFWIVYRNRTPYPGIRPWRNRLTPPQRSSTATPGRPDSVRRGR
jgi:sodium transport system permease protein